MDASAPKPYQLAARRLAAAAGQPFSSDPVIVHPTGTKPNKLAQVNTKTANYAQEPIHQVAWNAISKGLPFVKLGDTRISNPRLELPRDIEPISSHSRTPPPTGFVLGGTIYLFGLEKYPVHLRSWHGPSRFLARFLTGGNPIYQVCTIKTIPASEIIPLLADTPVKDLLLREVSITYQNYSFASTLPVGLSVSATFSFDKQFGNFSRIIPSAPDLRVVASFGQRHGWSTVPRLYTFSLLGIFDFRNKGYRGLTLCGNHVLLDRIGARITAVERPQFGLGGKSTTCYNCTLFGEMHLQIPNSQKPLIFDFQLSDQGHVFHIMASLQGSIWQDVLATGFNLENVQVSASFSTTNANHEFALQIVATLNAGTTSAIFSGSYSTGDYHLSADIEDFGVQGISDLYHHITGEQLVFPEHFDILIGNATVTISKKEGFSITVDNLEIDRYKSVDASIHISSYGVTINGSIANVSFLDFDILSAKINISLEKQSSSKSSNLSIQGQIKIDDFSEISAVVHLYKGASDSKLEWTVYGTFSALGPQTSLGKALPIFHDSFLKDIVLEDVVFIAASKADPKFHPTLNQQNYPINQGIQICAMLGTIDSFRKLLRRPTPGLILSAGWSKQNGFDIVVDLPSPTSVHLGRGISTDPISVTLKTQPKIDLSIAAGIKLSVPNSSRGLDFQISLSMIDEDVDLVGQMLGVWRGPFGISRSISIANLALEVGINLPEFFVTGTPSTFGFSGAMAIGAADGAIAVQISEDPTQELLSGHLDNLGVKDIIAFLREITGTHIPDIPNFFDFKQIRLYMSTGVLIGTTSYPAGFSFEALLTVFGKSFSASAEITKSKLSVSATIDNLHLGPLKIGGLKGKDASLDLEIGTLTQELKVDGAITFLSDEIAIYLLLEIQPHPRFSFDFVLHFTELLTFDVKADVKGDTANLNDLSHLEFDLTATFEQHILDYVREQVIAGLQCAKEAATGDIKDAESKITNAEKNLLHGIADAKNNLDAAYASWQRKSAVVHKSSQAVINQYTAKLKRLQRDIDAKRRQYNTAMRNAEAKVEHANADRAAKIRNAEVNITKTKAQWDEMINTKEGDLEEAKRIVNEKFGNAEQDILDAEARVDGIQNQINDVQGTVNDYEDAPWYHFGDKAAIPVLEIEVAGLWTSMEFAEGVLKACNGVLEGADYLASKAAIPLAEDALEAVKRGGDEALAAAKLALQGIDKVTQEAVDLADDALKGLQKIGDVALRGAEAVMDAFIETSKAILEAAQAAIGDLIKCGEWLAYQTAKGALDLAQHATHALDVAKRALDVVKAGVLDVIDVAEEVVKGVLAAFDITLIKLSATMGGMLGKSDGKHFDARVEGKILGRDFNFSLDLDLEDISTFIHGLVTSIIGKNL